MVNFAVGVVSLSRTLDFEVDSSFFLITVNVTDNGNPALSGTRVVNVSVLNVNDAPVRLLV
jgi:hypothetical protein